MMPMFRSLFLLFLCLSAATARAQNCVTPLPPGGCTFLALDAAGNPIDAFCVGQPVRFVTCPGRVVNPALTRYGVRQGANVPFQDALGNCAPPSAQPFTYTPQTSEVGDVTVSELSNFQGAPFYYIRTFRVYGTAPPAFTAVPCPNSSVLVTITDAAYDSYVVQIGAASQVVPRNQPTTLPVPAGATTVTVTGRHAALATCNSQPATLPIAPLAAPQTPLFSRLTQQANGNATLDVGQLPAGYIYSLQVATGSGFSNVASVPAGSPPFTQNALPAGCYRLLRTDACGITSAASATICTLTITGSSAQNRNRLVLTTAADPGTTYTVTRTPAATTPLTVSNGAVEDAAVQCGTTYTYLVSASQPGGGVAVSNEVAVPTQSALPPPLPRLLASFNRNNVVELTPLLPGPLAAGSTLRYRRTLGAAGPTEFGTATTGRPLRDSTALSELRSQPPCYTVALTDICGNTSAQSPATCPALLAAAPLDADGNTAVLTWTPFTGPDPVQPATYVLQRLAADGAVLSSVPVSGNRYDDLMPPTDRQLLRYRLRISGAGLPVGAFSYSNLATVSRRLVLAIPTAFTPNGDGRNDVLEVKGKYLRNYIFVVYDRNGQEVFRGNQHSDVWDGSIRGRAPANGAYAWRFQQQDEEGVPFSATGSVTILK